MINELKQLDASLIRSINQMSGNSALDQTMIVISSSWLWIIIGIVAGFYFIKKKQHFAIGVMIASLVALALSDYISFEIVKQAFRRERPCWELEGIRWVLGSCGGSFGFTSNHAANAGAVAMTIWLNRARITSPIVLTSIALALAVGFSRVYLGVHYPGDVVGGYVLGSLVAFIVHRSIVRRWSNSVAKVICRTT